jgi:heat shock protein HtpX
MSEETRVGGLRFAAAANILKAWLIVAILSALAGAVGWALAGTRGATLFVFCSVLAALAVYAYGDRALLGMLGARPYALAEDPLLKSTIDKLAAGMRVLPPRLYLIDDLFPRALAVGRGPRSSTVAVSTGLLGSLPPDELSGVLAHELAHVRSRDVLPQTFAVLLAAMMIEASRIGGWLSRALLYVLAPIGAAFVHLAISPKRELAADQLAAIVTGAPQELADALMRLDRASELVAFAASPATGPLYPVDPFGDSRLTRMYRTHPPLEDRIARLRAMASSDTTSGDLLEV